MNIHFFKLCKLLGIFAKGFKAQYTLNFLVFHQFSDHISLNPQAVKNLNFAYWQKKKIEFDQILKTNLTKWQVCRGRERKTSDLNLVNTPHLSAAKRPNLIKHFSISCSV